MLSEAQPDPSMAGALPPGAWWRARGTGASTVDAVSTNGSAPGVQPYGPDAGDAAVLAARRSALELREVHFAYPLRPGSFGESWCGLDPALEQLGCALMPGRAQGELRGVPIASSPCGQAAKVRVGAVFAQHQTVGKSRVSIGRKLRLCMAVATDSPLRLSVPACTGCQVSCLKTIRSIKAA